MLQFVLWTLEAQQDWSRDALFAALKSLSTAMELKPKVLFAPIICGYCRGQLGLFNARFHGHFRARYDPSKTAVGH